MGAPSRREGDARDWGDGPPLPDPGTVFEEWRARPVAKEEVTQTVGDADGLGRRATRIKAR